MKRKIDIVVISDTHLGTYGCHAKELSNYLKSIKPSVLILNGDIVDMWQFKKSYFPTEHIKVINRLLKMSVSGTKVYYLTGNHDDMLRRFSPLSFDNFHLRDDLLLQQDGKKFWFFHGDVFDTTVVQARWLAKIGGKSYDTLVRFNKSVNWLMQLLGKEKIAFSKIVKMRVKEAVKFIGDFETKAVEMAEQQGYDFVICGHIHTPQYKTVGNVTYLNSGDWVENLTALEYSHKSWSIYHYDETDFDVVNPRLQVVKEPEFEEDEMQLAATKAAFVNHFFNNAKPALDQI
jgi:UDP-2,3-diacylglucosamine pyrophosphatase LpxH